MRKFSNPKEIHFYITTPDLKAMETAYQSGELPRMVNFPRAAINNLVEKRENQLT